MKNILVFLISLAAFGCSAQKGLNLKDNYSQISVTESHVVYDEWQIFSIDHEPLAYKSYSKIVILDKYKALTAIEDMRKKMLRENKDEAVSALNSIEKEIIDGN